MGDGTEPTVLSQEVTEAVEAVLVSDTHHPPVDKIGKALAKAQHEMKPAKFNKVNPHYKSKYADLAAIREATLPALNKNGMALYQGMSLNGTGVVLRTLLIHESGQTLESEYPIPLDQPQKMGSALTYARRYCWSAMCGIVADEDDDANAASDNSKPKDKARTDPRAGGQHEVGAFVLWDAFGIETQKFEKPDEYLTALANNVKDNSAWFEPNKDQVAYIERTMGDLVPDGQSGNATYAKWCRKLRKLATPPQTALEAG